MVRCLPAVSRPLPVKLSCRLGVVLQTWGVVLARGALDGRCTVTSADVSAAQGHGPPLYTLALPASPRLSLQTHALYWQ
jgi:hypothetical protein